METVRGVGQYCPEQSCDRHYQHAASRKRHHFRFAHRQAVPLNHLRKYSNYLTPKLGLFSADSWVLVATYLRNLILNWLLIAPLLIALLAIPRVHVSLLNLIPSDAVTAAIFFAGFLLAACGMAYSTLNRPAVRDNLERNCPSWFVRRGQHNFLLWCFAPLCGGSLAHTRQ